MLLHDSVTDTQPQPSAFTKRLRGVERIENAVNVFDPWTVIVERNAHQRILLLNSNSQTSAMAIVAFPDRVQRVVDDVKEYLLQLMRVRHHRRKIRRNFALHH